MGATSDIDTKAKEINVNFRRLRIAVDSWYEWTLDNAYSEELAFQVHVMFGELKEEIRHYNLTVDAIIKRSTLLFVPFLSSNASGETKTFAFRYIRTLHTHAAGSWSTSRPW